MQELEKILEEIDEIKVGFDTECRRECDLFDWSCGACVGECDEYIKERAKEIIRKHMNDGWIPVQDKLPEDDVDVLITYADIDDENYTDICITTYGYAYLGGHKLDFKEWRSPFEYFKTNYKIIAWCPLPEPYRPERSNGE